MQCAFYVSMPFKTGLGTAGREEPDAIKLVHPHVSMPFKTGLGTAGDHGQRRADLGMRGWKLVSMPFKTGLGTAGNRTQRATVRGVCVSMPFKTGLGTAGCPPLDPRASHGKMFQCPLRRAWVLRKEVEDVERQLLSVSMPFKTGLGTAGH